MAEPFIVEDTTVCPLIYFVSAEDRVRFPIKIGRSTTKGIKKRLGSIQTGMPYRLKFMVVCEAPPEVELQVHREFADLRLEGEWFKRTADLVGFIDELRAANPEWADLLGPRYKYAEGHEPPPDDALDLLRFGMNTAELHWRRKRAAALPWLFPSEA